MTCPSLFPAGQAVGEADTLAERKADRFDFDPGSQQYYSNFGFVVLGAIVERIMGLEYGPAVHRLVFESMGVQHARVGHGGAPPPHTARRYGDDGKELPPLDVAGSSAGGWIVSTVELVRFLAAIHDGRGRAFLSPATRREMLAPPSPPLKTRPNGSWFGLGWDVVRELPGGPSYMKNGGLAGVRAVIGNMPGNVDWAATFNHGHDVPGQPGEDADATRRIQEAIAETPSWPEGDQFSAFI